MSAELQGTPPPADPEQAADLATIKYLLAHPLRNLAQSHLEVIDYVESVLPLLDMGAVLAAAEDPARLEATRKAFRRLAELQRRIARAYQAFGDDAAAALRSSRLRDPIGAQGFLKDFLARTRPQFAEAQALNEAELNEAIASDLQKAITAPEPKVAANAALRQMQVFQEKQRVLEERYKRGERQARAP